MSCNTYFGKHWTRQCSKSKGGSLPSVSSFLTRQGPARQEMKRNPGGVPQWSVARLPNGAACALQPLFSPLWCWPRLLAMPCLPPKRVLGSCNCPWMPTQLNKVEKWRSGAVVVIQVLYFLSSHLRKTQGQYLREPGFLAGFLATVTSQQLALSRGPIGHFHQP